MVTIEHPLDDSYMERPSSVAASVRDDTADRRLRRKYWELISAVNVLSDIIGGGVRDNFRKILTETFTDQTEALLRRIANSHTLFDNMETVLEDTKLFLERDFEKLASELIFLLHQNADLFCNKISVSDKGVGTAVFQQFTKIDTIAKEVKILSSGTKPIVRDLGLLEQDIKLILDKAGVIRSFYDAYHKALQEDSNGIRGLLRIFVPNQSSLLEGLSLQQIIEHAFSKEGRTLKVLKDLKWLEKVKDRGFRISEPDIYNVTKTAPNAFKEAFIAHCEGPAMTLDPTPDSTPRASVLDKSSSSTSPRGSR